jgi:hypothetical protein
VVKKSISDPGGCCCLNLAFASFIFFPSWVKYGWSDIPARGKFVFADMSTCVVEAYTLSGGKLPKGIRPFGYVTVIPDTVPKRKLFGHYKSSGTFLFPCDYRQHHAQLGVTIIFHPNPYIQAGLWLLQGWLP